MQWIRKHTYAESEDRMYRIIRLAEGRDKCALHRWDERYRAHTRLVAMGTEAECKERVEECEKKS